MTESGRWGERWLSADVIKYDPCARRGNDRATSPRASTNSPNSAIGQPQIICDRFIRSSSEKHSRPFSLATAPASNSKWLADYKYAPRPLCPPSVPSSSSPTVSGDPSLPNPHCAHPQTPDTMDMDLSLILGPIVLAVVFNVRLARFGSSLPSHILSTGCCVRNVYHPVVQLLHLWVQGPMVYPVRRDTVQRRGGEENTHPVFPGSSSCGSSSWIPSTPPRRPTCCGNLWYRISASPRYSFICLGESALRPLPVSLGTIESVRQAIPNHSYLQYVILSLAQYLHVLIHPTVVRDRVFGSDQHTPADHLPSYSPFSTVPVSRRFILRSPPVPHIKLPFSASVPVQIFLAYRIKGLSRSWHLFAGLVTLSLAQGACGFAGGVLATINPE